MLFTWLDCTFTLTTNKKKRNSWGFEIFQALWLRDKGVGDEPQSVTFFIQGQKGITVCPFRVMPFCRVATAFFSLLSRFCKKKNILLDRASKWVNLDAPGLALPGCNHTLGVVLGVRVRDDPENGTGKQSRRHTVDHSGDATYLFPDPGCLLGLATYSSKVII